MLLVFDVLSYYNGYFSDLFRLYLAKGRTNYELHPETYALRDGVAQTMTSFKPRLISIRRPICQHQSCIPTPIRVTCANLSLFILIFSLSSLRKTTLDQLHHSLVLLNHRMVIH